MPLVFVHGVSNRDSQAYRENQFARDAFFRSHVLPSLGVNADTVRILDPYWGDAGVKFRWDNASLPQDTDEIETFGGALSPAARLGAEVLLSTTPDAGDIALVAKRSLPEAVEIAWSSAFLSVDNEKTAARLAQSHRRASAYAAANPNPAWLKDATGGNFLDLLDNYVTMYYASSPGASVAPSDPKFESFGFDEIRESLQEGLSRIAGAAGALSGSALTALRRTKMHQAASFFLGDIFQYLNTRGTHAVPGPIVQKVLDAFVVAREQVTVDDPKLVIVGHSLGGVITYDILTYFAPALEVDVFVTVGSQVALFEEMSLYKASKPGVPPNPPTEKLPRPKNIKRWLNVLCNNDMFSFRAAGVFSGVEDYRYDTGYGVVEAHSGYFNRPSFYTRLGEHLTKGTP